MNNLKWTRRRRTEKGVVMTIQENGVDIAEELIHKESSLGTLSVVDGDTWRLEVTKFEVTATTESGTVMRARSESGGRYSRASIIDADLDGHTVRLENVGGTNWVIEDTDGVKLGQFTGFHSGVRDVEVDFSDSPSDDRLTRDEACFIAWLARLALESKLDLRSNILIGSLGFLSILGLIIWFI